jgi:hypothetical protein
MGKNRTRGAHQNRLSMSGGDNTARFAPSMATDSDDPSPNRILELGYAFRKSKALLSAVELGLFTTLADGPLDLSAIVARTGIHDRGAGDFLDALVALDLLDRDEQGRYSNRTDCGFYLDKRKHTYIGGPLEQISARLYASWAQLTQALRTGLPPSRLGQQGYDQFYDDPFALETFLHAMSGGSLIAAQELAEKFPWQKYRTVIDIGTAQGCVPVQIVRAHSHLTGGGFDLPRVEAAFRRYVSGHGLSHRLQFHPGDFLRDALPGADVLIMGRILHNWDLRTKKSLVEKAYRALPNHGALIVYDALIDNARRGPAHSLLASLNMLIETTGGCEYTADECTSWMRETGFADTYAEPLGALHTAVIAIKRAQE